MAVPRIAVEGELEIAPPNFVVVEQRSGLFRGDMIVKSVIAWISLEPIALEQWTSDFATSHEPASFEGPPCFSSLPQRFRQHQKGRYDVVGACKACESASSTLVPAVFLVLIKMNLCSCETII